MGFCNVSAMRKEFRPALGPEFDRLRVVLVQTRNPLNIAAAARAMSNFGFTHLALVNPYGPAFRWARSAVGPAEVLATGEEYDSVAEAVGDCVLVVGTTAVGKRSIKHAVERLEQGAEKLRKWLATVMSRCFSVRRGPASITRTSAIATG